MNQETSGNRTGAKRVGKYLTFVPIGVFVLLFIAEVVARFLQKQPAPVFDPLVLTLSTLLLLSFLVIIVTVPIGLIIWWRNR